MTKISYQKKKALIKSVIIVIVLLIIIIDIPIPHSINKHGVTVYYNHYLLNRIVLDILTMDHAAQNDFLRENAERELYRKLCDKYLITKDKKIADSIITYFNSNTKCVDSFKYCCPDSKIDIELICKCNGVIFFPRLIY